MSNKRVKSRRFMGVYFRESDNPQKTYDGKRDRCFWVTWRDAGGKFRWEKIGWASQGHTEATAYRRRRELSGGAEEPKKAAKRGEALTLDRAAGLYFTWCEAENKHVTAEQNRYDKHLKPTFGHLPLDHITDEALASLKTGLLAKYSPQSVKHILGLARRIINRAIKTRQWSGVTPFGQHSICSMPVVDNESEAFLTPDDARRLVEALRQHSPQLADMTTLALSTGLRACEVYRLQGKDINKDQGILFVTGKGGKRETVFASPDVIDMLWAYGRGPEEYIFQARGGGKITLTSDTFRRVVESLGLDKGGKRGRVTFHTARHSFASALAGCEGVTVAELQRATRHKRMETLKRYLHATDKQLQSKVLSVAEAFTNENP